MHEKSIFMFIFLFVMLVHVVEFYHLENIYGYIAIDRLNDGQMNVLVFLILHVKISRNIFVKVIIITEFKLLFVFNVHVVWPVAET